MTSATFHILLALSLKERHGYEIMQQTEEDSNGRVMMGPGTLYTAIKRLLKDGLIVEAEVREEGDERRKYYKLTRQGKTALSSELECLSHAVFIGQNRLSPSLS